MSQAPVCHISPNQGVQDQPPATLLPAIPFATDLASAIQAINIMKLMLQMLAGQMPVTGAWGIGGGFGGGAGGGAGGGQIGPQGKEGPPGPPGKAPKTGRWVEVPGTRITQKKRIFQDNDNTSDNWVDIERINHVEWKDTVTGELFTWDRGADGDAN